MYISDARSKANHHIPIQGNCQMMVVVMQELSGKVGIDRVIKYIRCYGLEHHPIPGTQYSDFDRHLISLQNRAERLVILALGLSVDSAREQEKLEARKKLENVAESPASSARGVSPRLTLLLDRQFLCNTFNQYDPILVEIAYLILSHEPKICSQQNM